LATDRQTNGQTNKQMDRIIALSRSRCRERRLSRIIHKAKNQKVTMRRKSRDSSMR